MERTLLSQSVVALSTTYGMFLRQFITSMQFHTVHILFLSRLYPRHGTFMLLATMFNLTELTGTAA
jgi:hypothetical protein